MEQQPTDMPGADRDDESGKYRSKYPTEDFLDAIADAGGTAGTQDVADAVGCSYETAYKKLRALEDSDVVESTKFGNARAWSVADESAEQAPRERSASQDGRDTTPDDERRDATARVESEDENHREVLRAGLSGSGDLLERRVDAILAMYDYLREHGEATNDELQALADPDVVDYAHAESVWSNMVKGKDTLRALPGVEKPGEGRNAPWKYRGDDTDA